MLDEDHAESKRMAEQIRVGLIGTSGWSERMYLSSLAREPRARVEALCGRRPERTREVAGRFGVPRTFADFREMIADGGLDAVIVAAPDDEHHEMALAEIDAGLHVLCEKPLARSAAHAHEMCTRARRRRGAHDAVHLSLAPRAPLPGRAGGRRAHRRAPRLHLSLRHGLGVREDLRWRSDPARSDGVLAGPGSHLFDLVHWWLGPVSHVSAELHSFGTPHSAGRAVANDSAAVSLRLASGAHGTVHLSSMAHVDAEMPGQEFTVFGSEGTLEGRLSGPVPRSGWSRRARGGGRCRSRSASWAARRPTGRSRCSPPAARARGHGSARFSMDAPNRPTSRTAGGPSA